MKDNPATERERGFKAARQLLQPKPERDERCGSIRFLLSVAMSRARTGHLRSKTRVNAGWDPVQVSPGPDDVLSQTDLL